MWGYLFIDAEKMKLKSPLKQIEVDDFPIRLDDIIVKDHFFGDVFAVESY